MRLLRLEQRSGDPIRTERLLPQTTMVADTHRYMYGCLQLCLHVNVVLSGPFLKVFRESSGCFQNVPFELAAYTAAHDIGCRGGFHCLRGCLKEATDVDANVFMQFALGRACGQA